MYISLVGLSFENAKTRSLISIEKQEKTFFETAVLLLPGEVVRADVRYGMIL